MNLTEFRKQLFLNARPKRRSGALARPRLPNQAERLYLGAMRRYSDKVVDDLRDRARLHGIRLDSKIPSGIYLEVDGIPFETVGQTVARHGGKEAKRILGLSDFDLATRNTVEAWRRANVALVTQFTQAMYDRLDELIAETRGAAVVDIADRIEGLFDMTRARAELIARDQTLKLNAQIHQSACGAAGIDEYVWSTSQDGSVRDEHEKLEGLRFRFTDPPVAGKYGEVGNPGELFQCRCVAIPWVPEIDALGA